MDEIDRAAEKGDEYAKRMLFRNRMSDCYSRSYRRRLSIIEAINKNSVTTSNLHYNGNPFEKEFPNANKTLESVCPNEEDGNNLSRNDNTYEEGRNISSQTYNINSRDSLLYKESIGPNKSKVDNYKYEPIDLRSDERHSYKYSLISRNNMKNEPRLSIGEPFGTLTSEERNLQSFLNKKYEKEFQQYNKELERQGPDEFFGARVIEIIEPVIVKYHRKSIDLISSDKRSSDVANIKENLKKVELQSPEIESSESFGSEDMRELDREIDRLQDQYNEVIYEEVKSPLEKDYTYRDNFKELTNHFNKLNTQSSDTHPNIASTETLDFTDLPTNTRNQTYMIATPETKRNDDNNKTYHGENNISKTASFLRRHTSFLFKNLRTPKLKRRKSNKMSTTLPPENHTLKQPSFDDKTITKFQHQIQQVQSNVQPDMDDTMASEMESFLKAALGSGNYNSTMAYDDSIVKDRSNSFSHSIDDKKIKRTPTLGSRKRSSTLNRTLTIYKTLTQRIKEKFRRNEDHEIKHVIPSAAIQENILRDLSPNLRKIIMELQERINVQDTLIYQTSKALELCDTMREFTSSPERVEYERLLLLASLTRTALLDEIDRLIKQDDDKQYNSYSERGEVTLKELRLQLREDILRRERQNGDVIEWFVIVVNHFTTVWATHAIACPISSPMLIFPGQLSIPELTPDFRLKIRVYSMKLQQVFYNHEDKYHIPKSFPNNGNKKLSKSTFSPNMLRKKMTISPKQHKVKFSGIKESSFVFCGSVDLMLYDLKLPSPWPLTRLPSKTVLHGTIDLNLSCKLELAMFHAGFITHCEESGDLAWNRRWCLLEGHNLLFWNYPREQEYRTPIYTIDLVNCVSSHIELIDRTLCARPRTLVLETTSRSNERDVIVVESKSASPVVRHLLSCDTHEELTEWQSKLNHVITALRDWNIIHTNQ